MESPEVAHYGYVLEGLPTLDYEDMTVQEQLEMIRSWKLNPDFVINIKVTFCYVLPANFVGPSLD